MASDAASAVGLDSAALSDLPAAPGPKVGLPDWAIHDNPAPPAPSAQQIARPQTTSRATAAVGLDSSVLADLPAPPVKASPTSPSVPASSRVGAVSSGLYRPVAEFFNSPTYAYNAASDLVHGLGGADYGQLTPPINVNPTNYQPKDALDRSLQAGSEAVASVPTMMVGGEIAAPLIQMGGKAAARAAATSTIPRVAAATPVITDAANATAGAAKSFSSLPGRAPVTVPLAAASGGAAGQYASEQVPERYAPLVNMVTNLAAGGGVGAMLEAGPRSVAYLGRKGVGFGNQIVDANGNPLTGSNGRLLRPTVNQQKAAGEKVLNAAGPDAAQVIADVNQPGSPIPGVDRTLAQQSPVPGIVSLDTAYRTSGYGPEFDARAHAQGTGVAGHLADIAPPEANPQSVGKLFTAKLDAIQADKNAAAAKLTGDIQNQTDAAGGLTTPSESGAAMQTAIERQQSGRQVIADQITDQARVQRDQAAAATPTGKQDIPNGATAPEQYGAEARGQVLTSRKATTDEESRLWQAINPDGTAGAQSPIFKSRVQRIYDAIPNSAKPPSGEEANIVNTIQNWPDVIPLTEFQATRSRLTDAIAEEINRAGHTTTDPARRMIATKEALDSALEDTLNAHAATEQQAVRAGQMSPEATLEARLREQWGLTPQAAPPTLRPYTAEEIERTKNARAFSRQRAQTFDEGVAGEITAPGENRTAAQVPADVTRAKGGFDVADAEVMGKLWNGKDTEAANLRGAQEAGITPELLKAHAADDLRSFATDANGDFDPNKYAQWRRDHAAGLHIFPEVKAAFDGVAKAQETLAARQAESEAVAASHPLKGVTQPSEVPGKYLMRGDTGADMVRQFVKDTSGDATAMQAFDDSLVRKMRETKGLVKPDGTIDPEKLNDFRNDYKGALSQRNEVSGKLSNLADAQTEYDRVMGDYAKRAADLQNGVAKNFLNDDPLNAVRKSFGSGNPERTFSDLVAAVRGNPDAEAGLKRAVADFLVDKFSSARPAGADTDFIKSGQFRAWLRHNRDALKVIFGGTGVNNIDQVAAELRRQAFAAETAKGSPTTQRIIGAEKEGLRGSKEGFGSLLWPLLTEKLVEHLTKVPLVGAAIGKVAENTIHAFAQAGVQTRNDLVKTMLLHPSVTRQVLAKVAPGGVPQIAQNRVAAALQATLPGVTGTALRGQ